MVGRHWPLLLYPLVYITTKRRKLDWARLTELVPGTAQELRAFAGIAGIVVQELCFAGIVRCGRDTEFAQTGETGKMNS
jgi:hypothetical protein